MLSRKHRIIRYALVCSCLLALLGAQLPGGTSPKVTAQSKGDLQPQATFGPVAVSTVAGFPGPTSGSPYPANFVVSGLTGGLVSVSVLFNTMTISGGGGFLDDIDMILVSPGPVGTARAFNFWSEAGGGQTGALVNVRIADTGATFLPDGSGVASTTTYKATDHFICSDVFNAHADLPATVYNAGGKAGTPCGSATFTSVFQGLSGTNLNGTWKLYLIDHSADGGESMSVTLDITAAGPTAADSTVSGTITDEQGTPVAGTVVNLSGSQNRKTISNGNGYYQFDQVETSGFYTVTPTRANYDFSPSNQSFSQLGNHTNAAFTGSTTGNKRNPLDTPEYFVRQQYLDVLGREPDEGGFNYWSDEILRCGTDSACTNQRRREVAASFFIAEEFQATGSYIYDMYKGTLGRRPVFSEYSSDRQTVIGGPTLETQKATFADNFVQRAEFVQKYQGKTTGDSFVDTLLVTVNQSAAVDLSGQRSDLIAHYNAGANMNQSRSLVLQELADNPTLRNAEYNAAFVLTEYFSYLQRNPEPEGYDFWLNVLNNGDVGNYPGMVCSFVTSTEYQNRFSPVVTHTNAECGH